MPATKPLPKMKFHYIGEQPIRLPVALLDLDAGEAPPEADARGLFVVEPGATIAVLPGYACRRPIAGGLAKDLDGRPLTREGAFAQVAGSWFAAFEPDAETRRQLESYHAEDHPAVLAALEWETEQRRRWSNLGSR